MSAPKLPLWTCPRCGHRFITRNIWHSCARIPLAAHFASRPATLRLVFRRLTAMLRRCGPLTVYAQKTRIVLQGRVRFGGVVVRRSWLEATFWLDHRASHRTLRKIVPMTEYESHGYAHRFHLTGPEDLDPQFGALLRDAYRVGQQRKLV
jgi:hypothetical protein